MPMATATRATARPILPKPTMPMVLPDSSISGFSQKQKSGQADHLPACTAAECCAAPRQMSNSSAKVICTTSSVL